MLILEIIIIILLILTNGMFAMAEMALVSSKKNRLQQKADKKDKGAVKALQLLSTPDHFLSTVQIGITLIGILSGAFGGATLAQEIAKVFTKYPKISPYGETIGVVIVVILITYLSLVLGELVPKRIALNNAENISSKLSPLMLFLSKLTKPLGSFLSHSTNFVVRLIGSRPSPEPEVTDEDIKSMMDQGKDIGIFEESEQEMVSRILRLSDRDAGSLMTPRTDIIFLDVNEPENEVGQMLASHPYSRFPVIDGSFDNVIGIVNARDLLLQKVYGSKYDIRSVMSPANFFPEMTPALNVLDSFRKTGSESAVIVDEYGGVIGLLSMNDVIEAIVGGMVVPTGAVEAPAQQREDGSWLLDGMLQIDEVKSILNIDSFPEEDKGYYETLSGLMMIIFGSIPKSGEYFDYKGLRFEVVDMDGNRVDKVLVTKN